jgi:hypothetical protein
LELIIKRTKYEDKQTLGVMQIVENDKSIFTCYTLELADKNNQQRISCIPKGIYKVVKRTSVKFKHHFHVLDVPNREWILIHAGNFHKDTSGCILVGNGHADLNADGYKDITGSTATLKKLLEILPAEFTLRID